METLKAARSLFDPQNCHVVFDGKIIGCISELTLKYNLGDSHWFVTFNQTIDSSKGEQLYTYRVNDIYRIPSDQPDNNTLMIHCSKSADDNTSQEDPVCIFNKSLEEI